MASILLATPSLSELFAPVVFLAASPSATAPAAIPTPRALALARVTLAGLTFSRLATLSAAVAKWLHIRQYTHAKQSDAMNGDACPHASAYTHAHEMQSTTAPTQDIKSWTWSITMRQLPKN